MAKKATIKDVAAAAGVSITTVSFVLNNTENQTISKQTRDNILKAVEELNYVPNSIARSMRSNNTMTLGIVSFFDVSLGMFNNMLAGMYDVIVDTEYSLVLCPVRKDPFQYVDYFNRKKLDGIIIICPFDHKVKFNLSEHLKMIDKYKIPAVFINSGSIPSKFTHINFDFFGAGYTATKYLVNKGHRKIYYILPEEDEFKYLAANANLRIDGYKSCLYNNNVDFSEDYLLTEKRFSDIIGSYDGNHIAVVANKFSYLARAYKTIIEHNLTVGNDVSIIAASYDTAAEFMYPTPTCVSLPMFEIGKNAVLNIIAKLQKKVFISSPYFHNRIIEGDSVLNLN